MQKETLEVKLSAEKSVMKSVAVSSVANDGMVKMFEMLSNLVIPAREWLALHEAVA
jgi:hypothetical protein